MPGEYALARCRNVRGLRVGARNQRETLTMSVSNGNEPSQTNPFCPAEL